MAGATRSWGLRGPSVDWRDRENPREGVFHGQQKIVLFDQARTMDLVQILEEIIREKPES